MMVRRHDQRQRGYLTAFMCALSLIELVATHVYIPVMPTVGTDLGLPDGQVRMGLASFLVAFGFTQLCVGALADRLGLRSILIGSLVIYCVGSLVAGLAVNYGSLMAGRVMQGVGAAAGPVLARAMAMRIDGGRGAEKRIGLLMFWMALAPGLAPMIAGAATETLGWRSVFALPFLLGGGLTAILIVAGGFADAKPEKSVHQNVRLDRRGFALSVAVVALIAGSYFALLSELPFIAVQELDLGPMGYGAVAVAFTLVFLLSGRLTPARIRRSHKSAVLAGLSAMSMALGLMWAAPWWTTLFGFVGIGALFFAGLGLSLPAAIVAALRGVSARHVGAASSAVGAAQMLFGGALMWALSSIDARGPGAAVAALCCVAMGLAFALFLREGSAPKAEPQRAAT